MTGLCREFGLHVRKLGLVEGGGAGNVVSAVTAPRAPAGSARRLEWALDYSNHSYLLWSLLVQGPMQ